jgi:hypothetical protein
MNGVGGGGGGQVGGKINNWNENVICAQKIANS